MNRDEYSNDIDKVVVEPHRTRGIEMIYKFKIVKVPEVGNTAATPNPLGIYPL